MVMSHGDVVELAHDVLIPGYSLERARLDLIDNWWRWTPEPIKMPAQATAEARELANLRETPWMRLLVTMLGQQLEAEGVRSSNAPDRQDWIWSAWQRNRMASRQRALHRAALAYGYSYATVMPGDSGAVIRGRSPRNLYAVYQDSVVDEYPAYYVLVDENRYTVVDEEAVYSLVEEDGRLQYVEHHIHDIGVAPAVRYSNEIDLEGRTSGEIEPMIVPAKRIDKTMHDRLLIQHHASFRVITATGLTRPANEEEARQQKVRIAHDAVLAGEQDVQYGTLPASPLDGIASALRLDLEWFAAASQTPAHAYTGDLINLSADALEESRAAYEAKGRDRKIGFGDSHEQVLRLAAHIENRPEDAQDFSLSISWADHGARSLSQSADALGKVATMLGVPPEKLWDRIPGVTPDQAAEWLQYTKENPNAEAQLAAALERQSRGADA